MQVYEAKVSAFFAALIMIVIAGAFFLNYSNRRAECEKSGGMFIRSDGGYCIKVPAPSK